MSTTTKYVCEIAVRDPDTGNVVEMEVYKHSGGGMFAIDSSYLDQVSDVIYDPFQDVESPRWGTVRTLHFAE